MVRSVSDGARYAKKYITYKVVLTDNPLFLQVPDITTLLCLKYDCIESYKMNKKTLQYLLLMYLCFHILM